MVAKTSQSRRKPAAPQVTNARFFKGSRPLGEIAGPFIQQCCAKYGFSDIRLFRDWAQVAGPHLASRCRPVKIVTHGKNGRVLHLLSPGGFATEVEHSSAAILDRINAVYGFCAVDKIRVIQTGAFESLVPPPPPPTSSAGHPAGGLGGGNAGRKSAGSGSSRRAPEFWDHPQGYRPAPGGTGEGIS